MEFPRAFPHNLLKNPVEIGHIIKPGLVTYVWKAIEFAGNDDFAGFVDADFVEEADEGFVGVFFEVTAECLRREVGDFGNLG